MKKVKFAFLLVGLLTIVASSPADARIKTKSDAEMFAESELVIIGTTDTIDHVVPGYPRIRQMGILISEVLKDDTGYGISAGEIISNLQLRPTYSDTFVYHEDPIFAIGDNDTLYLIEVDASYILDFDGDPVPVPGGTHYLVFQDEDGKRPVGGGKGTHDHGGGSPGHRHGPGPRQPFLGPDGGWNGEPLPHPGILAENNCCIYLEFAANAFADLTNNPGHDINFTAVQKTWIKNQIKTLVTADYSIPGCPVTVTTDKDDCDGASFSVTAKIGGASPGPRTLFGKAPDSEPGKDCITGKEVFIWTQEFGFKDGDDDWANTKEKMAQSVANIIAHEVGHQFGLAHGGHSAPTEIMETGRPYKHIATNDMVFTGVDQNKIIECCCPPTCINRYANYTGVFGPYGFGGTFKTKTQVKVTSVNGTPEKKVGPNWVPVKKDEVLPAGTEVRVAGGHTIEVVPHVTPKYAGAVSHLELADGIIYVAESGNCPFGEHCGCLTPIAEGWINAIPDSSFATMVTRHDPVNETTWIGAFADNDFPIESRALDGPDTLSINYVSPGNLIEYGPGGVFTPHPGPEIGLDYLNATAGPGVVDIDWGTFVEIGMAGFGIHRSTDLSGPFERIEPDLIYGAGTSTQVALYLFSDTDVDEGVTYHYMLEAIDLFGLSHWFGPVSATPPVSASVPSLAAAWRSDHIAIEWSLAADVENAGFNIYRNLTPDAIGARLNDELIWSAGSGGDRLSFTYADVNVESGFTYFYWLEEVRPDGTGSFHGPISAVAVAGGARPDILTLLQNSPNPFTAGTAIRYALPATGNVSLTIYNLRGQKVRTLVNGNQPVGHRVVQWDGRDDSGAKVAGGVYFYRLQSGNEIKQRMMIYLK